MRKAAALPSRADPSRAEPSRSGWRTCWIRRRTYLAARYVLPILARMERPPTRETGLAEFARRASEDVGGFQIAFSASQRRGSSYVTQTLLTGDGRQVG